MRILEYIEKDGAHIPVVRDMSPEEEEAYYAEGEE